MGRGQNHFRKDLVWPQIVLALSFGFWYYVEPLQRSFAHASRADQSKGSSIRHQNGNDGGRTDELGRAVVTEDGVVTIFAFSHQILARLALGQQSKATPKIPAARALKEIA